MLLVISLTLGLAACGGTSAGPTDGGTPAGPTDGGTPAGPGIKLVS